MPRVGKYWLSGDDYNRMLAKKRKKLETAFEQEHENDTDEQLLEYLRQECLKQKRPDPVPQQIVGLDYIKKRFGSWGKALKRAGIEIPPKEQPVGEDPADT